MISIFRLLCFILTLSVITTVNAQILPAATRPAGPPTTATLSTLSQSGFTRADTVRAIRKLFRSRRGGVGWLAFGTAGIAASTLPALQTTSAGIWEPGVAAGSALFLPGLKKRLQFPRGRERRVLRELAATGSPKRTCGFNSL